VAAVRPPDAREFLSDVGLPTDHVLFAPSKGSSALSVEDRQVLPIGTGDPDSDDAYVIDTATGEILYLNRVDLSLTHVSASPRKFDDLLRVFESETTAVADDPEDVADRIRLQIENIDPTALDEDPGFWGNVLFDVANGDYTDDED
jgi:hypothetical protein